MGCVLFLLAVALPRVTMIFILLLTGWFQEVFKTWVWPMLGFVFFPYTTLAYMAAYLNTGGAIGAGWLVVIVVAALADLGHWGGGYRFRRIRREE